MSQETIVAVFETPGRADQAADALKAAGVQTNAIERHSKDAGPKDVAESRSESSAPKATGFFFWDMMLAMQSTHQDRPSYERSVERGETVLAVTVSDREADRIMAVLEEHSPIDLDAEHLHEEKPQQDRPAAPAPRVAAGDENEEEDVIRLAEEEMQVGKQTVNRGTTRIRRYVVETPVEQTVSLRDEKVTIERRKPVTDDVTGDVLTEKTVEVSSTSEKPVVEKVAHLKEEVVVHREATEHLQKVRDTVQRDEVAVEEVDETGKASHSSHGRA